MQPLELTHPDTDATTDTATWLARWAMYIVCQVYHHSAWLQSYNLGRTGDQKREAWNEIAEMAAGRYAIPVL